LVGEPDLDTVTRKQYDGRVKARISVTLSDDLLAEIDRRSVDFQSRSVFLETAARGFLQ